MDTGNTTKMDGDRDGIPVHPRGYGEHTSSILLNCFIIGSSPWIRGTRAAFFGVNKDTRFIPVDTGNTIFAENEALI